MKKILITLEDFIAWLESPIVNAKFYYETKILPKKVPHYWCKFYDWVEGKEKEGWYIFNRKGRMIPWIHFDNDKLICLYLYMVTPIEKKEGNGNKK